MNAATDARRFTKLLETLGELYDVTVSAGRSTLYFGALREFEYEIVELAISKFLQSDQSKFGFPKPAHLREIIEGSQSDQESNAWLAVNDAIRKIGIWNSILVADLNLADAIVRTFGSWAACCEAASQANNFVWENRRRDFIAAYRLARRNVRRNRTPVLLGGLAELTNRSTGRFPAKGWYGAILLDGRVQDRYLDINTRTGLPAASLDAALALPEPRPQLAITAGGSEAQETGSDEPVTGERLYSIHEAISKWIAEHGWPSGKKRRRTQPTEDELRDLAGKERIRRQAANDGNVPHEETSESVRAREATRTGDADHVTDHGGGTSTTGSGVQVRGKARARVGGGSRMAGVEDPVRAGGKRVRERGSLRSGKLDDGPQQGGKRKANVRGVDAGTTRRKT